MHVLCRKDYPNRFSSLEDTKNDQKNTLLKVDIDYIAEEPDLDPVTMQFNKERDSKYIEFRINSDGR